MTIPNIMEAGHNVLRFNLRDRRSVDTGFWAWLQWGCGCALEHQKNDLNESKNNMCWNDFVKKNALSVWLCESILFNTFDIFWSMPLEDNNLKDSWHFFPLFWPLHWAFLGHKFGLLKFGISHALKRRIWTLLEGLCLLIWWFSSLKLSKSLISKGQGIFGPF